jgi:hypothetical protein
VDAEHQRATSIINHRRAARRPLFKKKNMKEYINNLFAIQKYLQDHDNIKVVSIAKNGMITVVFDNGEMSENDCRQRMKQYGISDYTLSSDWHTNTIFVKFQSRMQD